MAGYNFTLEHRQHAQKAAHQANLSKLLTLVCVDCQGRFQVTGDRWNTQRCEQCRHEHRRKQHNGNAKKRTLEQREAGRRRAAERKGKPYKARSERAREREAKRAHANAGLHQQLCLGCGCAFVPPNRNAKYCKSSDCESARNRAKYLKRYQGDPAREIARVQAYKKRNPDKNNNWGHRRRVRVRSGFVADVNLKTIRESSDSCLYCGVPLAYKDRTVDHVVPVQLGGPHCAENLVVACRRCNSSKGDSSLNEWLERLAPRRRAVAERLVAKRGLSQPNLPMDVRDQKLRAPVQTGVLSLLAKHQCPLFPRDFIAAGLTRDRDTIRAALKSLVRAGRVQRNADWSVQLVD